MPGPHAEVLLRSRQERKGIVAILWGFLPCLQNISGVFPLEGRGGKRENGKVNEHDSTGKKLTEVSLDTCKA